MSLSRRVKLPPRAPKQATFSVDTVVMSSVPGLTPDVLEQAMLTALQAAGFAVCHIECQEVKD